MTIRTLAEVGARLEEAVRSLPGDGHDLFDRYEMVAIQILDSEFLTSPGAVGALPRLTSTSSGWSSALARPRESTPYLSGDTL
ncbi:MAG: hypothetical protein IPJ33_14635 [Gammaproteobacteria bacterium]|nr:hypothetical protein [Gammaproteobacteria bacterium]